MPDAPTHLGGSTTVAGGQPGGVRLRHVVLLAGAVGPKSLAVLLGRSILDLPLESGLSLLDVWSARINAQVGPTLIAGGGAEVLVLAGEADPLPAAVRGGPAMPAGGRFPLRAARDVQGFRGTAGALRDLCDGFRDDDHVLVCTASQCPDNAAITELLTEAEPGTGVTLSADSAGRPSGLMLITCGALRQVTSIGYIDLKEQALPRIAETSGVQVIRTRSPVSPAIRDFRTYLSAVLSWHRSQTLLGALALDPFEERWRPSFAVIEAGAEVATGARIHDSVVLRGACVLPGAEVVRSVVGPGAVVRRRRRVLDELVLESQRGARVTTSARGTT